MASGAPKKVLTVAMTLGLMASLMNAVPTAVLAQEDDQVVGGNAGAAVASGEETADLALLHKRDNYNPRLKHHHKLPPQKKIPRTQEVHIDDRENVVGDNVDFNLGRHFRNVPGDLICVYGLPPGLDFHGNGHVIGRPTTQGLYKVRVLVKDSRSGYVTAKSEFEWKIEPRNAAPKLEVKDVSFPATGKQGTFGYVPLNVSDDQPIEQLTFQVRGVPGGEVVFFEGSWKLKVPTTNPANHNVRVTVSDAFGASDDEDFRVSIVEQKVNQAPVVSFVPVAQQATGYVGTKATAVITAKDDGLPNGQLTARPKNPLPAGWVFGGSNGHWTITVPSDKPIPLTGIEVVVSDGELETTVTVGICIWEKPAVPQYAPIGLVQPVSTVEGKPVDTGIFVYDADTHISKLNVEVVGENPAGVVPKRQADGSWILHVPATKVTNGPVLTELKVTDDTGLSTTFPAVVTVSKNVPAVIGDIANQSHWVGTKVELPVPVDPSYFGQVEVAGLPAGLQYDPASGKIVGTTTAPTQGARKATVSLIVGGQRVTKDFTWTVIAIADRSNNVGDKVDWDISKDVPAGVKPSDVQANGLPEGLELKNGRVTGTVAGGAKVYKVTFSVPGKGHQTTFNWDVKAKPVQPKPNVQAPTGLVNPVIAFKGDPTVRREIFVDDPDTDDDKLVVSLVNAPAGVTLAKEGERWFMVVATNNVIPTSQVDFKVSDGKNETPFATSVTVKDRDPNDTTPSIDNPGGQTSEVGEKIDPLHINTHNVPKGVTPKVEGLPEGLSPKWNPNTGVIIIEGTPSKPTDKPANVIISVPNPKKPNDPISIDFPWQVNPKGGEDFGPKGWVNPVKEKVAAGKKVEKPIMLADADTPLKDLKVTMTNKIDGVQVQQKAPGQYVLVVDLSKKIDLTKALFQVTDGTYTTLFETTVLVEDDKPTDPGQKTEFGPTGEVNPVIAFVGDPTVRREIFLKDNDTPLDQLKLERVSGPEQAKLVKDGNRYFLEVTTATKLDTSFVSFKVSDGKTANTFSTTVTVKERPNTNKPTPSIDNPGGQTSKVGKPIDPLRITTHNVEKGDVPKVEGLPQGLTHSWDPNTGVITITGTPTVETNQPRNVTISVNNPNNPKEPVSVTFPWQVNADRGTQKRYAPVGQVDGVHEPVKKGDKVVRKIALHDNDTKLEHLTVTMIDKVKGVELVKKSKDEWVLEVSRDEVIPLTKIRFQVSDGEHLDLFENTVSIYDETGQSDRVSIEVPDGKTTVNTQLPPLKVTVSNAKPENVKITPALPAGLKYDAAKGEITGVPTKVAVTKHVAEVTNDKGVKATDDFTITVTDAVKPGPNPPSPSNPGTNPGGQPVTISGTRIQGPTRVETAIAISRRQFKDQSVQSVVLARDDQYADANAGTPFADSKSAPVLLTQSKTLHPEVEKEIRRILKPGGEIWIMGREAAIDRSVEEELGKKFTGFKVHRIGGENRFETAAMIYDRLGKPQIVSIVDGGNPSVGDALVAGAAMAYKDGAVLYTSLGKLAPETKPVFEKNRITTKYTYDPQVTNGFTIIGGNDSIARSISTAKLHWGTTVSQIGVASSKISDSNDGRDNVVDALTGGAMVARRKAPMLLTPVDVNDKRLSEYVSTFSKSSLKKIWLYGGTAAVPQNVADALGGSGVKIQWDTFNWTDPTPADPDKI